MDQDLTLVWNFCSSQIFSVQFLLNETIAFSHISSSQKLNIYSCLTLSSMTSTVIHDQHFTFTSW
jgi:hypothetical protein